MAVAFSPGQTLGRGDLDIFLSNANGNAANAYSISYAIYYVDPDDESEVVIGSTARTPVNPAVGEYYASLQVPSTAVAGDYRIRWTFKEFAGSPDQQVVQEWAVVASSALSSTSYTTNEQAMIDKLRILLRDNCVGAEETVELDVDGERVVARMDDLWDTLHDLSPPPTV